MEVRSKITIMALGQNNLPFQYAWLTAKVQKLKKKNQQKKLFRILYEDLYSPHPLPLPLPHHFFFLFNQTQLLARFPVIEKN